LFVAPPTALGEPSCRYILGAAESCSCTPHGGAKNLASRRMAGSNRVTCLRVAVVLFYFLFFCLFILAYSLSRLSRHFLSRFPVRGSGVGDTFPLFLKSCAPHSGSLLSPARRAKGFPANIPYLFLDATRRRRGSDRGILVATLLVLSVYPALGSSTPLFASSSE
jgi:hypothetical protein